MDLHSSGRFHKDYRHGVDALEDLHRLGSPDLSPVIGRVHYHLSEIRRKAQQSLEDHPGLEPLKTKIKEEFRFLLEEATLTLDGCHQLVIREKTHTLNLMQWGRLIEVVPMAIKMISQFPVEGMIEASFDNKALELKTRLQSWHELENIKSKVYRLSRECFEKKILPTFQVGEAHQVIYRFDFSHIEDFVYSVDLVKRRVNLSNIFQDYQIPIEKVDAIHNQTALIMSANGEFYYFENLNADVVKKSISKGARPALFHFPFLFRPLSIIIPRDGEIAPLNGFDGTGCEKLLTDQDFGGPTKPAISLDIFSLLSK